MRIDAIAFEGFSPFANGEMLFPAKPEGSRLAEVQIFTGQNGTGKTRLLSLLASALGNDSELEKRLNGSKIEAAARATEGKIMAVWRRHHGAGIVPHGPHSDLTSILKQGIMGLSDGWESLGANVSKREQRNMAPFAAMAFKGTATITDANVTPLSPIVIKDPIQLLVFDKANEESQQICQSLVNIKMAAAMDNLDNDASIDTRAIRISAKLEEAVSIVTSRRVRFSVKPSPKLNLKVSWGSETMQFMQLPDGLRCLIGWLVSCVAKLDALFPEHPDPLSIPIVLLLDEPEGHLHPAWQRQLLPAAQSLLPNGQFFVATHSPFVISSIGEGWIHVLRADEEGKVRFDEARECSKGDSYMEVVEDILGVREWYDPESEGLLTQFRKIKNEVLGGAWNRESELRESAKIIAERSESLRDLVGGELLQFERLKKQSGVSA